MSEQLMNPPGALAVPDHAWGVEGTSTDDLVIPRISLQHPLSHLVQQQKAKPGDFVNSSTQEILAKPVEFIPVKTFRQWLITDANDNKKLIARIMVDKSNEAWSDKGVMDGRPVSRVKTLNFFVLLPSQIEELPFLLSLKKSGLYAGKILSTHFQTSGMRGLPPARHCFNLDSEMRSYNGNNFHAPNVKPGRNATEKEIAIAYQWYQVLSRSEVKVEADAEDGTESAFDV